MRANMTESDTSGKSKLAIPSEYKWGAAIFLTGLVIFGVTMGERLERHSHDNHYVYLADAMLNGRFHLEGAPPHRNDWARYDGRWYVSFPPLPAVLMMPGVAVWGLDFNDRLFTLPFAAAGPALLFLLLTMLVKRGMFVRKPWELALLSAVYGLGTVYYFAAVQGSVWYTAHIVGSVMLILYAMCALAGSRPVLAGLFLAFAFACRPTMLLAFPFFLFELVRPHFPEERPSLFPSALGALTQMGVSAAVKKLLLFGFPIAVVIGGLMAMNWARFDDPFEFGHNMLQVKQTAQIQKWGLFHTHYLARNLAVAFTLLPWISGTEPYVQISLHGLAMWFTTPILLYVLWPKENTRFYKALIVTVLFVAVPNLLYQNSGWVQFGYRFSLDYLPFLLIMVAAGGRRFGKRFITLCVVAFAVNLFGAVTFDRMREHYPHGRHMNDYFQPD